MKSSRLYDIKTLDDQLFDNIDFLLIGPCGEERAAFVPNYLLEKLKGKIMTLDYDIETEKYVLHHSDAILTERADLSIDGKDLMPNLINELMEKGVDGKSIMVDSTSIVHPVLFYLLKIFKSDFNLSHLFVTYTEPKKYRQNDEDITNRRFDLTEKFCNRSSIPGFIRAPQHDKEKTLIVIMGFEGNRFSKTYEEVNPATHATYAVVGMPSYHPSWQYYVYAQNRAVLAQSKAYLNLDRATAYDPFGVYNVLSKIVENESLHEVVIAPLGTKPHSIGACMFAIDNDNIQLYYDYPFLGKKIRTEGVGRCYLYNLTGFINE